MLLPQLYPQEVADVASVREEVRVRAEGIVIHVPCALSHGHFVRAEVGESAGLLEVAVGEGHG